MSCVEVSVEQGRKRQSHFSVSSDCKVNKVRMISFECESMSLSDGKSEKPQFSATKYQNDCQKSPSEVPEEGVMFNVLADDLNGEADWDMTNLTWGSDLRSLGSILNDYDHFRDESSLASEAIISSSATLLSMAICCLETKSSPAILEGHVGGLKSACRQIIRQSGKWSRNWSRKIWVWLQCGRN